MNSIFSIGQSRSNYLQGMLLKHSRNSSPLNEIINNRKDSIYLSRKQSNVTDRKNSDDIEDLKRLIEKCLREKTIPRESSHFNDIFTTQVDISLPNINKRKITVENTRPKLRKRKRRFKNPKMLVSNRTPSPNVFLTNAASFPKRLEKVKPSSNDYTAKIFKTHDNTITLHDEIFDNSMISSSLFKSSKQFSLQQETSKRRGRSQLSRLNSISDNSIHQSYSITPHLYY